MKPVAVRLFLHVLILHEYELTFRLVLFPVVDLIQSELFDNGECGEEVCLCVLFLSKPI